MRQVFRLMDKPDRVIAFDELPEDLLTGLELCDCSKLPRDWREFIGMREKVTKIQADRDPFTGAKREYTPIVQKGPYAYLVDRELNSDNERWQEIESYVRRNAPKDFRLLDKIADMARPMARDVHSELSLEPTEVTVIPLPKEGVAVEPQLATVAVSVATPPAVIKPAEDVQPLKITQVPPEKLKASNDTLCIICDKTFSTRQALRMHTMKKHKEAVQA